MGLLRIPTEFVDSAAEKPSASKFNNNNSHINFVQDSLVGNGDFEDWTAGTSVAPDNWTLTGSGAAAARSSEKTRGSYSAQVTYGAADAYLYQDSEEVESLKGKTVAAWVKVKCDTPGIARIKISDGVGSTSSEFHDGDDEFQYFFIEHEVASAATRVRLELHVENTGAAKFDEAVIVNFADSHEYLRSKRDIQALVEEAVISLDTTPIRSVTTTDSPTTADEILLLSGASFTVTLYTAVGNTGKRLRIIHDGTSLTQVYTLNTTSSQTIGGIASGAYALYTNGERLELVSDGTNWKITGHEAETDWVNAGVIGITGTTSNPTKGSVQAVDKVWWKRSGREAFLRIEFRQSNATSSAAGSGDYLFATPSGLTIDTGLVTVYATVEGGAGSFVNNSCIGTAQVGITQVGQFAVSVYDSTHVRFLGGANDGTAGCVGSAFFALTNTTLYFLAEFRAPISGWRP